jgi:hypothetical protein
MKRPVRDKDTKMYLIHGKTYREVYGSRTQVMNENAYKTTGLLVKSDLIKNKNGYIVSLKKHKSATKDKRLEKAGWFTKKGKFGSFNKPKRSGTAKKPKSKKSRTAKNN